MTRCWEFFEGDNRRFSMTRLMMFMSFWPASYVVVVNAKGVNIPEILGIYLGSFVLGYIGGKGADVFMQRRKRNASIRGE